MEYVNQNNVIIGYTKAPNKYQKWYRPIDTFELKRERNLSKPADKKEKFTEAELATLKPNYYWLNKLTIELQLIIDYSDFEEIKLCQGIELSLYGISASPNEWYVAGILNKNSFIYKELLQFVKLQKPSRPNLLFYDESKHKTLIEDYNKRMEEYN